MNFLPLEELEPTLTDVLAFIDTFESDTTASTASSSDDGKMSPPPLSAVERRKTRKAAASRRCQQKKRAEHLALRAQVTALETRLHELHDNKTQNWVVGDTKNLGRRLDKTQKLRVVQLWRDKARLELQLRQQSEQRNRQLLDVVTKQSRVARAVKDVLDNVTSVVHIEEALRTPPPTHTFQGFVPSLHDAIYGELSSRLGRMYVEINSGFDVGQIQIREVSTGVQVRRDAVTGLPYVELRSAVVTSLDFSQTEKVMMNMKVDHYRKHRKYMSELGTKKETELELRDEEMALALSTLSLSRTYEDENRSIVTFSSLVSDHPVNSAMRFREEGFVMVSKSPTDPQSGSVIQARYRLTPEIGTNPFSSTRAEAQNAEATNMFVLQNLGAVMWAHFQRIQADCIEAQQHPELIPPTDRHRVDLC
ncbi:hypothetical protein PF005_g22285 [Phytophthora fragariae]|uniref:BZIP domain-containing protein n=1 Tax=Phytophthora fragariae TaxID=53985 RepID=A0A6A4C820_9STRA|nr:hypothetical protein PF003_g36914 [Phytophthora fragariae]KAE8985031.1 hypothetical protein PF011_g20545 [Phytophthora fragariae]KAE9083143.1 hypothetical protein PF007_g22024 [Phytophthora fragariae]KAE9107722.1 hypothetical protein PF006_g21038 [Phytophthora fragariae]KAE9182956.1 hypothetical protein PF005_g22285 [Phytophthora fragariae]